MPGAVRTLFVALVACLSLACGGTAQTDGALARVVPQDTRIATERGGLSVTLGLSRPVPFRVFALEDPWRIVIDLRDVVWDGVPAGFGATGVRSVIAGAAPDPGWSRMVLALDRPMLPRIAAMDTDTTPGRAAIRLTLAPVSAAGFAAQAGLPAGLLAPVAPDAAPAAPRERLRIALDPGHGGIDPGAVRGDVTEADLVLHVARDLAATLRRTGRVDVILTRQSDVFVPLPERMTRARAAGADAFVSIHADALAEGRARGATVYTLAEHASDAASAALAERHDRADLLQGVDLSASDDDVAGVLMDLARLETAPRAEALADTLVARIRSAGLRLHSRPRGEAGFTVLRAADIPSVLVEIGFMSDPSDLENLRDPAWRSAMQAALAEGILAWAEADALRAALLRQ